MTKPLSDCTDWQLSNRSMCEREALEYLLNRHRDYVSRLAWPFVGGHACADDVTQVVFLRIAEIRKPLLPFANFKTWIYRVILNVAREHSRKRGVTAYPDLIDESPDPNSEPYLECELRLDELKNVLSVLPQRQRKALVLRHLEGMSTKETVAIMKCSEGSVKTHLHRAIQTIQKHIE